MLTISRPFAQGQLRGLMAPPCECGNEMTPYGIVRDSKYGDLLTGVEALSFRTGAVKRSACLVFRWRQQLT